MKGKVEAGKTYVKGKIASVKAKVKARADAKAADVKAAAQRGAARGWQAASRLTKAQVVKEPELKAALRGAERGAAGPRIRLDLAQSGETWKVKAEASQGRQRATVDQGAGWIARSERGAPSFAATNLTSFNQGLAREVMAELRRTEAQPSAGGLRAEYDRKVAAARRLESSAQGKLNGRMRGLTLAVKQEPFAGAERDKQIKTTVTVSPNSTVLTEDDPLGGAVADADFPYAVDKAGGSEKKVSITRVGRALQYLRQIKIPLRGRDPSVGYVVNMLALPDQAPADIASRYLDEGWSGAGADNVAAARTAVVVGINRARSVDAAKDAEARSAINGAVSGVARDGKLLMAAFGMIWTPAWKNTKTNKSATFAEVRRAAAASPAATQKAIEQESGLRDKGALPYGALREEVLNSSYTRKATEILSKVNDQVYMLTQDADGGAKAASGSGIFKAYDDVLAAAKNNPHLVIGGYTFEGFNWAADAPKRTVQLTTLANQLDRAIREVVGKKHPQALYPTEPSLLIKVWDRNHLNEGIFEHPKIKAALGKQQGSFFGFGASEGRAAETSMEAMGPGNLKVVHDPRASVTTSPAPKDPTRGFMVSEGDVRAHAAGEREPGSRYPAARDPMYAVIVQSQSHASAVRLAQEFRRSNPALGSGDQQQMETYIFDAVEDIAILLSKDPQLTAGSPQVAARVALLDAKAQEIIARRGGGAPERGQGLQAAHQLTKDIITALTADQLKGYWTKLSALLAEIMGAGAGTGGANR